MIFLKQRADFLLSSDLIVYKYKHRIETNFRKHYIVWSFQKCHAVGKMSCCKEKMQQSRKDDYLFFLSTRLTLTQYKDMATVIKNSEFKLSLKGSLLLLFFLSRRACVRHTWWRTKPSWPLFSPTFFFLFSSSYAFCSSPTSGKFP